jgi:hypothetical protein
MRLLQPQTTAPGAKQIRYPCARVGPALEGYGEKVPELPDVEGFRRVLSDHAVSRRIRRVDVLEPEYSVASAPTHSSAH